MSGRQNYTIELTDAEAATITRMVADRRKTPKEIVRHLVRNQGCSTSLAVSLATGG